MEDEQGIYRGEVLADIEMAVFRILRYIKARTTMKRKRKNATLLTPEERAGYLERLESLWRSYERLKIELETGKRSPRDPSPSSS